MGRVKVGMSAPARDAAAVLGQQVRLARQERSMTATELAARAGVSARTVTAIEHGDAAVSVGNVLNVASAAGVPLFGAETPEELRRLRRTGADRLALIPTRVRHGRDDDVDTDF